MRLVKLAALAATMMCMAAAPQSAPSDWPLTFNSDFSHYNPAVWDTVFPWGERYIKQGELEFYVDPNFSGGAPKPLGLNPFILNNGILTIRADVAPPQVAAHLQGQKYTSGLLNTYHSFSQLYGYYEIRAKLPSGRGLWPAFWLLPHTLNWPPEIDVMEALGDQPARFYATVHSNTLAQAKVGFAINTPDLSAEFHRFGVLWQADIIAWYFDGALVAQVDTPADLHVPMYLLVNLAVGGPWPGNPDQQTRFPADLQIESIKAYAPRP